MSKAAARADNIRAKRRALPQLGDGLRRWLASGCLPACQRGECL